jgi:hypothetical protein
MSRNWHCISPLLRFSTYRLPALFDTKSLTVNVGVYASSLMRAMVSLRSKKMLWL